MPVYEYTCPTCGKFERQQRFGDDPLKVCPTCGGPARKLFSRPAIVFKGSGWYKTDSRGPEPSEGATKSDDSTKTISAPATAGESSTAKPAATDSSSSSSTTTSSGKKD